jgi:hypothetical protein
MTVPVTVWEQIPVIVIVALLLAGIVSWMVRAFSKAIADINRHYSELVGNITMQYAASIKENNENWQKYFDARSETSKMVYDQMVNDLARLADLIEKLAAKFEKHDALERQVLGMRASKRNPN